MKGGVGREEKAEERMSVVGGGGRGRERKKKHEYECKISNLPKNQHEQTQRQQQWKLQHRKSITVSVRELPKQPTSLFVPLSGCDKLTGTPC